MYFFLCKNHFFKQNYMIFSVHASHRLKMIVIAKSYGFYHIFMVINFLKMYQCSLLFLFWQFVFRIFTHFLFFYPFPYMNDFPSIFLTTIMFPNTFLVLTSKLLIQRFLPPGFRIICKGINIPLLICIGLTMLLAIIED